MNPLSPVNLINFVITKDEFKKSNDVDAVIGQGELGKVVKGECKGNEVAIKVFNFKSCPSHLQSEFNVHCMGDHPNLLKFHGVCFHTGKFAMMNEIAYINLNASFKTFLPPNKTSTLHGITPPPIAPQIAQGILKGVAHLHSIGFAHTNLKDTNVFLTENFTVKLGDFCLSKFKLEDSGQAASHEEGIVRWCAPEVFTREFKDSAEAQKSADMFSAGMLIWQLLSRKVPLDDLTESGVAGRANLKIEERIDPKWPPFYCTFLRNCCNSDPSSRPTAIQALRQFESEEASKVLLLFASTCGDKNVFAQQGMRDILKNTVFPLMFEIGS